MTERFRKFDDPVTAARILNLDREGKSDEAKEMVYRLITEDPDLTVEYLIAERKNPDYIKMMIKWYESIEEFRRCAVLKGILDRVMLVIADK